MKLSKTLKSSFIITIIALTLTACGSSSSDTPKPPPPVEDIVLDYQDVINDLVSIDIPGMK